VRGSRDVDGPHVDGSHVDVAARGARTAGRGTGARLTGRGWTLGVVGAALAGIGMAGLGAAVTTTGVFLVSLVVLAVLATTWSRATASIHRSASPAMISVGEATSVTVTAVPTRRWPRGRVMIHDQWPPELGSSVVAWAPGDGRSGTLVRVLTPSRRGRFQLGPARLVLTDPFGLARRTRGMGGETQLVVAPRIHPLRGTGPSRGTGWVDGVADRASAASGPEDSTVRVYQEGDDPRRIHWRATARHDALMTRNEERVRHASVKVIMDTRPPAMVAGQPQAEWVVAAVASICIHLMRSGVQVSLTTTTGRGLGGSGHEHVSDEADLLRALSDIDAEQQPRTLTAAPSGRGVRPRASTVVAVLAELGAGDAEALELGLGATEAVVLLPPGSAPASRTAPSIDVHVARSGEPLAVLWERTQRHHQRQAMR
jgi:uncharacterized protein (DUF58 family)